MKNMNLNHIKPRVIFLFWLTWELYFTPDISYAHGFGERYDLPVPLWLYISGAGMAVVLSFGIIGIFVKRTDHTFDYPRLNLLRWRIGRALVSPAIIVSIKIISVLLLVLVIISGFIGNSVPTKNIAPVFVWVIWWVGVAFISALVGNVWMLINPWKICFEWMESLYRLFGFPGEVSRNLPYPERIGVWPGFLLFFCFAWVEIVFPHSAIPANIAWMAIVYSVITWGGMFLFGKERWLSHGEAFSLIFGFLARFAPTELRVTDTNICKTCKDGCLDRDGQCINCNYCFRRADPKKRELNLRPYSVGLLRNENVSPSIMALLMLILATITFDGFEATPVWETIQKWFGTISPHLRQEMVASTISLICFSGIFIVTYLGFSALMKITSRTQSSIIEIACVFVLSLIPISLAYHLAHYLTYLLIQAQFIIPLISDPFGFGWNLFGTAHYKVNIAIVGAKFAWYTAVIAIVLGHIIAVYISHLISLRTIQDHSSALRSQYPMLVLMVGYTMVSLWILAQPIAS